MFNGTNERCNALRCSKHEDDISSISKEQCDWGHRNIKSFSS
jgi:hypothetical protein